MVAAMGLAQIRIVLFSCLAVILMQQAMGAGQSPGPDSVLFGRAIHDIEYKADAPLERSHYDSFLPMKPGDVLTRTLVRQAIQKLYETGEFSDIGVDASPEMLSDKKAQEWINQFKSKYKREPQNYSITAYNGVRVIADAVERVAKSGKPVTRSAVRDAIQATKLTDTLQGPVEFDENGDIKTKIISLYQVKDGKFVYMGPAPEK